MKFVYLRRPSAQKPFREPFSNPFGIFFISLSLYTCTLHTLYTCTITLYLFYIQYNIFICKHKVSAGNLYRQKFLSERNLRKNVFEMKSKISFGYF